MVRGYVPPILPQTKAAEGISTMSQYPLQAFLSAGVSVCINTDNMTVSNTTVADEIQKLYDAGLLTKEQAKLMVCSGIRHTFLSEKEKEELLQLAEHRMN
jgi:adenosine deaminase